MPGHLAASAAIAACFALLPVSPEVVEGGRWLLQVTPAGDFGPNDGRPMDTPVWRINAEIAARVVAEFDPSQPLVIDYDHQTLRAANNGQLAPAAGRIHGLRWIEGRGLFAVAELTPRARALIEAREYLYFSPVFEFAKTTGEVLRVLMGALTNNPAISGMQALDQMAVAASRHFFTPKPPETTVNPLPDKLLAAIGLPAESTEDAAVAACTALKAQADAARTGLKLGDSTTADAVAAACASLQTAVAAAAAADAVKPDPAKYVPTAVVDQLKTDLAALSARQQARDVDDLIAPALADGRLLPAQEQWARDLGKANVAALSGYLKTATPVAALAGTQTQGRSPANGGAGGDTKPNLTAGELAVAAACGITPEVFAAGKVG